jgi:hypothetical protein
MIPSGLQVLNWYYYLAACLAHQALQGAADIWVTRL